MNTVNLDINGKSVTLKFGYGLFRLLGEAWGVPGINGVMQRFASFENMDGSDVTFEQMDILSDFVCNAVKLANADMLLNSDDVIEFFMGNPKKINEVMTAFIASIPQPKLENEGLGKSMKKVVKPK